MEKMDQYHKWDVQPVANMLNNCHPQEGQHTIPTIPKMGGKPIPKWIRAPHPSSRQPYARLICLVALDHLWVISILRWQAKFFRWIICHVFVRFLRIDIIDVIMGNFSSTPLYFKCSTLSQRIHWQINRFAHSATIQLAAVVSQLSRPVSPHRSFPHRSARAESQKPGRGIASTSADLSIGSWVVFGFFVPHGSVDGVNWPMAMVKILGWASPNHNL